jgi:hypothetical protein
MPFDFLWKCVAERSWHDSGKALSGQLQSCLGQRPAVDRRGDFPCRGLPAAGHRAMEPAVELDYIAERRWRY